MFKDTPDGQTHFYGDSCNPPHQCPEGQCQKAYNRVCKVCNTEIKQSTIKDIIQKGREEFENEFHLNSFGNLTDGKMYNKKELPNIIKSHINSRLIDVLEGLRKEVESAHTDTDCTQRDIVLSLITSVIDETKK